MVSKHQIKLIKSLAQKKYRQQHGIFTVEGVKGITEFLNSSYELVQLYTTTPVFDAPETLITLISEAELSKISALKSPNTALALFKIPEAKIIHKNTLIVALDAIRDPGNLGTIIRLCDWFGVSDIVCSLTTVDCYNAKVVQASMGSLTRVNINYIDLEVYLKNTKNPIFGTLLEGENIYTSHLPNAGIIVLGNEANGISETVKSLITTKITIPQFGILQKTESLNVANAAAIVLSEIRRSAIIER